MKKVTKAVIPASGFGTRFLPQTKAMPKEMLPILNKPTIQYVVEQLVEAGITDIIIVTGYHKRSIEDYFDEPNGDLVKLLERGGEDKKMLLEQLKKISSMANFYFLRQKGPIGNFVPLLNARKLIANEPFIYSWADDFFDTGKNPSCTKQIISAYEKYDATILPCLRTTDEGDYKKYAYSGGETLENGDILVKTFIEKPGKDLAPSNLAAVDCQLYTPDILDVLDEAYSRVDTASGKEFGYFDAINVLLEKKMKVIATEIKGGVYIDTGDVLKFLKTQVYFGAKDKKVGEEFRNYLKTFVSELPS